MAPPIEKEPPEDSNVAPQQDATAQEMLEHLRELRKDNQAITEQVHGLKRRLDSREPPMTDRGKAARLAPGKSRFNCF